MNIEYEATFVDIDKGQSRKMFQRAGARLVRKEYLQKRFIFHLPDEERDKIGWLRVRDEGDKITMSLKQSLGDKIHDQKEICLEVNDFNEAIKFLTAIGCEMKSYQETKRELWILDGAEITIDEWPFLEPFIEVEAPSEEEVKTACQKIGLDYDKALFCTADALYKMKYGVSLGEINNNTQKIVFDMEDPFKNKLIT